MESYFLVLASCLLVFLGPAFVNTERICINYDLREFSDDCVFLKEGERDPGLFRELCRYGEFCFEVRNQQYAGLKLKKGRKNKKNHTAAARLLPHIFKHGIRDILYMERKLNHSNKTVPITY